MIKLVSLCLLPVLFTGCIGFSPYRLGASTLVAECSEPVSFEGVAIRGQELPVGNKNLVWLERPMNTAAKNGEGYLRAIALMASVFTKNAVSGLVATFAGVPVVVKEVGDLMEKMKTQTREHKWRKLYFPKGATFMDGSLEGCAQVTVKVNSWGSDRLKVSLAEDSNLANVSKEM